MIMIGIVPTVRIPTMEWMTIPHIVHALSMWLYRRYNTIGYKRK